MAEFPDFELIPADTEVLSPDDELDDLVDPAAFLDLVEDDTVPIGTSWYRDYDNGVLSGAPQRVVGTQSVVQIAQVALRTPRGVYPIFDDEFGMDHPDAMIGQVDDPEIRAHYERDVQETLLACHDRITAVGNITFNHDPDSEIGYLTVEVEIDREETVVIEGVPLNG